MHMHESIHVARVRIMQSWHMHTCGYRDSSVFSSSSSTDSSLPSTLACWRSLRFLPDAS